MKPESRLAIHILGGPISWAGMESQRISREGQMVLARLVESQIWHLPASSVGWIFQKRVNGLCPPFWLGESCFPAFAFMLDISIPPCISLVPSKQLPLCWRSAEVSLCKSMCGSLWVTAWDYRSFFSWLNLCCFLQEEGMGTYVPGTRTLDWGPGVGLGPLAPRISLLNFYPCMWHQPVLHLDLSY